MTINELRAKRNQAWEAAKAFVATKRDKDGLLSAEDAATYNQMEQKVKDYSCRLPSKMAKIDTQNDKSENRGKLLEIETIPEKWL